MTNRYTLLNGVFLLLCLLLSTAPSRAADKPRLIVTTDIGGDPDDQQAMVRLMVHSNEFDLEALIASASGTPGELDKEITRPDLIRATIDKYDLVRPNLILHDSGFPTAGYLRSIVKSGNKSRGWNNVGAGKDTEGSNWIITVVDRDDPRPVNVSIWGGQTDLAQALWKVKNTRSTAAYNAFIAKIRVHDISDQDEIFFDIIASHPSLFYVLSDNKNDRWMGVYRGMFYKGDLATVSFDWVDANVISNHGPLGALYPPKAYTKRSFPYDSMKEGDTPSWFYFLNNGLHSPENPDWGGWGGRFRWVGTYYNDASDTYEGKTDPRATVYRWRQAYNNEFAARMDWCVKSYAAANHKPTARLNGNTSLDVVYVDAAPGSQAVLSAAGSTDPDGNALSYDWFYYREAGDYNGNVTVTNSTSAQASVSVPSNLGPDQEIHVILQVRDNGNPALTSYRRAVIRAGSGPSNMLTVAPGTLGFGAAGGSQSVSVASNVSWTASESLGWLSLSPASGTGNGSVTVTATSHTGANPRSGSISFSGGGLTRTVIVTQQGQTTGGPLISALSPNSYKTATLETGLVYYTDRDYTVTSAPSALLGGTVVRVANNDKNRTTAVQTTFTLSQAANVYVAYDPRASSLPNWLSGWTATGQTLGVTDNGTSTLALYRKAFGAGAVSLGGNLATGASGATTNYVVIAKASGSGGAAWREDFANLPNGATSDAGATAWTTTSSGGAFSVEDGRFRANATGNEAVWRSGEIALSGPSRLRLDVQSVGPMEDPDYLQVLYQLDGGPEVELAFFRNSFNGGAVRTLEANNLEGQTLRVVIRARNSGDDEFHYWDNVEVSSASSAAARTVSAAAVVAETEPMRVYPNPVSGGQLHVVFPGSADLELFSVTGRLVRRMAGQGEVVLDVSDLPAGLYVVRKTDADGQVHTKKVVVN